MSEHSRGTVVAWVVVAVVATLALARILGPQQDAPGATPRIASPPASGGGSESGRSSVYIHVAGAVRRPGLLRLAAGSRVAMAIDRAGGPSPKAELTGVNLAARVQDGQQIVVPRVGQVAMAGASAGPAPGPAGAVGPKPSLGTATVEQLEELDGIGPTLAARIVEYRQAHGGFRSVQELDEVDGIGEKRLEALRRALQP